MRDFNDLTKTIKRIAIDAVENTKPANILFGTVTQTSPLKINVEQKIVLQKPQLVLTRSVTKDTLQAEEKVVLARMQGGQKYIVIDRVE